MIEPLGRFLCRTPCFLMGGLIWKNVEYIQTNEGDYSKWLGPDWKPQWSRAGTIVSNHVCWMDISLAMHLFWPSFISKASVKKFPVVGTIATAIGTLYVERASSHEERALVL